MKKEESPKEKMRGKLAYFAIIVLIFSIISLILINPLMSIISGTSVHTNEGWNVFYNLPIFGGLLFIIILIFLWKTE